MPRLPTLSLRQILPSSRRPGSPFELRALSTTPSHRANDSAGWKGREGDEHAVNRDGKDVQSEQSHEAMKKHESLEEGSQAISRKDEGNNNKRAEKDNPEAPKPVIGMNEERGSVSFRIPADQIVFTSFGVLTSVAEGSLGCCWSRVALGCTYCIFKTVEHCRCRGHCHHLPT